MRHPADPGLICHLASMRREIARSVFRHLRGDDRGCSEYLTIKQHNQRTSTYTSPRTHSSLSRQVVGGR